MTSNRNQEYSDLPKLTDASNYPLWDLEVITTFESLGLMDFVDGSYTKEAATAVSTAESKIWQIQDAKARKIILGSIDPSVKQHILAFRTSKEMYSKLKSLYAEDSDQTKHRLMSEFFDIKYDKTLTMMENISLVKNVTHRLKALKKEIDEAMVIQKIIKILPPAYKQFRSAWDSESNKTLDQLCVRLQMEESNLKGDREEKTTVAFHSQSKRHSDRHDKTCYKCNKTGHVAKQCIACSICFKSNHRTEQHRNQPHEKKPYTCVICKMFNHTTDDCGFNRNSKNYNGNKQQPGNQLKRKFQSNGERPVYKNNQNSNKPRSRSRSPPRKASFLASTIVKGNVSNSTDSNPMYTESTKYQAYIAKPSTSFNKNNYQFTVDSGANAHMSNDLSIMECVEDIDEIITTAKKQHTMSAKAHGQVNGENCELKNVLYVSELEKKLMSVNEITNYQGAVLFDKDGVQILRETIQVPQELVLIQGPKTPSGLFEVNLRSSIPEANLTEKEDALTNWHRKMGHLGMSNLLKLKRMCDGVTFAFNNQLEFDCVVCAEAKLTKKPHNSVRRRASKVLEIIHTDVCGPIDPETHDKNKYFVTFIDDFSHFTEVHLIQHKSEVFSCLKKFTNEAENQHEIKVKKIRCDNGGEYISNEFLEWAEEKGIIIDYTVPGCPELNGTSERMNRNILNHARAMIFDSELGKEMWGEAVTTAVYMINRSPTTAVDKLPAEIWYQQKQDLSNIKIFGTRVSTKILTYLKKLDIHARHGILVGYGLNSYRIWDPKRKETFMARDLNFYSNPSRTIIDHENQNFQLVTEEPHSDQSKQLNPHSQDKDKKNNQSNASKSKPQEINPMTREQRARKAPTKYKDFEMYLCNGENLSLNFQNCIQQKEWQDAIEEEKRSILQNNTWELVEKSEACGQRIIDSRWVLKYKEDGRPKARLVAKGCQQSNYSLQNQDTFSPVVDTSNLRVLLALAARNQLNIKTFDVKTAFLNGNLKERVFMKIPEGFTQHQTKVCLLKKSLYGLKQAPLRWFKRLTEFLKSQGLIQLKSDRCIFKNVQNTLYLAIHVDDGLILSHDAHLSEYLLNLLKQEFEIVVNHQPRSYLGFQLHFEDGLFISQSNYATNVLQRYGMEDCRSAPTPLEPIPRKEEDDTETEPFPYREALGSLQHLSCKTRPDITFAVNYASRYLEKPSQQHIVNVKRILRYLKGTIQFGIHYETTGHEQLECYSDADYAGSGPSCRMKSTSGLLILLSGGPVTWGSSLQEITASSTCEAEYVAAALMWRQTYHRHRFMSLLRLFYVPNVSIMSVKCTWVHSMFLHCSKYVL